MNCIVRNVPCPAALLILALAFRPLAAQDQSADTALVEPVVVSATRAPMSRGALPVAVTIIDGDELRDRGIGTVAEALTDVTSAYVARSGSQGATTSLFLRGGESKYVKVLIDGVPANEPGGTFDFASLTTDNVERIEIVRGPASVVHGPDAVTGVVHVITRRGSGTPRVESDIRAGTAPRMQTDTTPGAGRPDAMHTVHAGITTSGAFASGNYSLSVASHRSSGLYAFNNEYRNTVASGRMEFTPIVDTDVRLAFRITDYQYNYPTESDGTPSDSNAYRAEDRLVLGVELQRRVSDRVRAAVALNSSVNDGGTDDAADPGDPAPSSFVSQDKTRRRGGELRLHVLPFDRAALVAGIQVEQQDQRSQSQSESSFGPFNSVFRAARRNRAAFSELVLTPHATVTATVGARVDDNERFGTFGTGRVGLSWRPLAATRLRATAGNAFREPTFFENYATGFVTGNPDLRPERIVAADAGVEQDLLGARATVGLTLFAQRFRDMIDFESTGASCGYSYCNVAEARSNGAEIEARARVAGPLWASVAATMLRTRVAEPGFDSASGGLFERDQRLLRRPDRTWTAELAYRTTPLSLSARLLAVGDRDDRFFGPTGPVRTILEAYQRIDLTARFRLTPQLATTVRVENLANTHYQTVYNFAAPRRTIQVGVRATN